MIPAESLQSRLDRLLDEAIKLGRNRARVLELTEDDVGRELRDRFSVRAGRELEVVVDAGLRAWRSPSSVMRNVSHQPHGVEGAAAK